MINFPENINAKTNKARSIISFPPILPDFGENENLRF